MTWGNYHSMHKIYTKLTYLFLEFPIEYVFKRVLDQQELELQTVVHCYE